MRELVSHEPLLTACWVFLLCDSLLDFYRGFSCVSSILQYSFLDALTFIRIKAQPSYQVYQVGLKALKARPSLKVEG